MDRDVALAIIQKKVTNKNIIKHMLATEAVMRSLARRLDSNRERFWALAGLLHDGDYLEKVPVEKQGIQISEWIEKEKNIILPNHVKHAMAAHNFMNTHVVPRSKMDWALFSCDSLTGLIVASALVLPSKQLADLKVDSVLKRFKEPSFAKGTRRDDILECETKLGLSLEEFVKISLRAMQDIHEDLGL
ncbi:MAG: phosphohydrolase [Candidatus Daviesbacteria bacterium]